MRRIDNGRQRGQLRRALDELATTIKRTQQIATQTRTRLSGQTPPGATRLVSLHNPDARPIRKRRIDRPVEFGYKAQVVDNDDGIVVDYTVEEGDTGRAAARPGSGTHQGPGRTRTTGGDRRPGLRRSQRRPRPGGSGRTHRRDRTTMLARRAVEHRRGFRRLVKWRTGSEGPISYLKRSYGWDRARLDGREGAGIWCGHAILAHHLVKISALTA